MFSQEQTTNNGSANRKRILFFNNSTTNKSCGMCIHTHTRHNNFRFIHSTMNSFAIHRVDKIISGRVATKIFPLVIIMT